MLAAASIIGATSSTPTAHAREENRPTESLHGKSCLMRTALLRGMPRRFTLMGPRAERDGGREDGGGRPTTTAYLRGIIGGANNASPIAVSRRLWFGALCIRDRCQIFIAGKDFLTGNERNFRGFFMAWRGRQSLHTNSLFKEMFPSLPYHKSRDQRDASAT